MAPDARRPAGLRTVSRIQSAQKVLPGGTSVVGEEIRAKSGSKVLRVIAWVLGISTLVTLFSIASCAFFDYRARKSPVTGPKMGRYERTGGATPRATTVDARTACSLVSNVEVGEALGTAVWSTNKGALVCQYTSSVGRSLKVEVTPQGGSLALQMSAMAMKAETKGQSAVRRVVGIGDEAYAGRKGSTLMFRKGNTVVDLEVHTDGNSFQAATVIARRIATRLP